MTSHVHVFSNADAWNVAKTHIQDASKDADASSRAGYDVFRSESDYYSYICDLGDRLEVNLSNGDTLNVWIDEKPVEVKKPGKARNNKEEKNMKQKLMEKGAMLDVLQMVTEQLDKENNWQIRDWQSDIDAWEQLDADQKKDPDNAWKRRNMEIARARFAALDAVQKALEKLL